MKTHQTLALLCCLLFASILACSTPRLLAQDSPFGGAFGQTANSTKGPATPLTQLAWDADHKEGNPKPTDLTADFTFYFTNISDSEIIIHHVKPSCSCTVAKLPPEPWHLPAHTNGHIDVSVNLKDKGGEFTKTITVTFEDSNTPPKLLSVKIKMPDRSKMRAENMQIALADRQSIFKGECAKCHAEPAKTLSGFALYKEVCGICHDAHPRQSMIPDLALIKSHPTDYNFWRTSIANGKPGTMMPAFAQSQGGPLTEKQIDDMAQLLEHRYPYSRFAPRPAEAKASQVVPTAPPAQKN